MKFKKFGKALLMSALSAGVILSITSCAQSYSVGFLYVTGTVTSGSSGNGYVAGFKIDHNTGKLTPINGLNPPVSSGGANPIRALLLGQSRFLYVLNQGVSENPPGAICTSTNPCKNSNITEFELGANGVLTPQQTFYSQGTNPFRLASDSSGNYLLVLDHDSPDNYSGATGLANGCTQALNGASTCGDITVFAIDSTTGRLSLVQNKQVQVTTTASGTQNLTYFPVPANAIDFAFAGSNVMTLVGTPATGDTIFPYGYTSTTGQLSITSSNLSDSIGSVYNATALVYAGGYLWVLDNDPLTVTLNGVSTTSPSQVIPWSVGSNGALSSTNSGPIADDPNQKNPVYLVVENKGTQGTRFYVANQGVPQIDSSLPLSGVAGWIINSSNLPTEISPQLSFGAGAGPVCMVEDPSNQFFYTANSDAQNVTGQVLDQISGVLTPLNQSSKVASDYALTGPPTWCLVDGRIGN